MAAPLEEKKLTRDNSKLSKQSMKSRSPMKLSQTPVGNGKLRITRDVNHTEPSHLRKIGGTRSQKREHTDVEMHDQSKDAEPKLKC